ncbi:AraC family transcriptional regulator [Dysgonomonas sp. Marseille-P4361]
MYLSSGFKSQSSFNRAFKLHMNTTPSEYYKMIELANDED